MKRKIFISVCVCLLFLLTAGYITVESYLSSKKALTPVIETKHSEVKQLPEVFKKQIIMANPSATFRVPILLYHYVENVKNKKDKLRNELNIPPSIFEEQVKTLANAGYTFMTAAELGQVMNGEMQMPAKPILLTFDDGHWDVATDILPILQRYNAKATAYIIPGFTGGSDFMSQAQVQEVVKSGLIEIGAHTVHHLSLKNKPYEIVKKEVDDSKTMIENTYHVKVVSFAYPNGAFDEQAVDIVKSDGYTTAVSTVPGIQQNQVNRYFLYRIRPGERTGPNLLKFLNQNHFTVY